MSFFEDLENEDLAGGSRRVPGAQEPGMSPVSGVPEGVNQFNNFGQPGFVVGREEEVNPASQDQEDGDSSGEIQPSEQRQSRESSTPSNEEEETEEDQEDEDKEDDEDKDYILPDDAGEEDGEKPRKRGRKSRSSSEED